MKKVIVHILMILVPCFSIALDHNVFNKAYEDAKKFISKKEYQKALKLYLWIDENANEIDMVYHTVKIPAFSYWGTLASRYPIAMEKFKQVRDGKISQIKLGHYSWKLFTDIRWINMSLGESYITAELFEYLDQNNTEAAKLSYDTAEDDLIRFKRYHLARKYLGDPLTKLNDSINEHTELLELDESLRDKLEPLFENNVINMVTILDECNERELAIKVKDRALEIINSKKIKNLLK